MNLMQKYAKSFKKPTPHWVRWFVGGGVLLCGIWVAVMGGAGLVSYRAAKKANDAISQAEPQIIAWKFDEAHTTLDEAKQSLVQAEQALMVIQKAGLFPFVIEQASGAEFLVSQANDTITVLQDLIAIGDDLVRVSGLKESWQTGVDGAFPAQASWNSLPSATKLALLTRLAGSKETIDLMETKAELLQQRLTVTDRNTLSEPLKDVYTRMQTKTDELVKALHVLSFSVHVFPEMAGLGGQRTHLLLFINNQELRPGGGFIGSYGVLTMNAGELVRFDTSDVYTLDRAHDDVFVTPPAPLKQFLPAPRLYFRDSNWSPDFAVSARSTIERFIAESRALSPNLRSKIPSADVVHDVIAITPEFVEDLFAVLGPIEVDKQTFTAENVIGLLEYDVEYGYAKRGLPEAQRKTSLLSLIDAVKQRLLNLSKENWKQVIEVGQTAVNQKHILAYSEDTRVEDRLTKAGIAGRVLATTPDVRMVVDANLSSLKTDPWIKRSVTDELFKNNAGQWVGRTTLTYKHTGSFSPFVTRYRNYVRLYLPSGSTLVKADGFSPLMNGTVDQQPDLGLLSIGGLVVVEPGTTQSVTIEYLVSNTVVSSITSGHYALTWIKQAGGFPVTLTLQHDFGKKVSSARPPEQAEQWGNTTYSVTLELNQDQIFTVDL